MARLIVIDGPDLGAEYKLELLNNDSARETIIGRDPGVDIPLNDRAISREHCKIETRLSGSRLIDLGSRNRTYLNNDPVETCRLSNGDLLLVGDTELRFEDDSPEVEGTAFSSTILKEIDAPPEENLLKLSASLGASGSVQELFDEFFSWIAGETGAERGMLLEKAGRRWVARASGAVTPGEKGSPRADMEIVERTAKEGKTLLSRTETSELPAFILSARTSGSKGIAGVVYLERAETAGAFDDMAAELLAGAVAPLGINLERIAEQELLLEANRNLLRSISDDRKIIGESEELQEVLDFIQRAAPTPMTVLVQGETGTGKELVASALHYGSQRRNAPFIALNCAALPENLVESELFGHEKGAFTGAIARKKGRFELADGGTVFLDEVGELTLSCQAKLLRLLEERCFERVGGTSSIEVEVRIIAATNRNLQEAVEAKDFREDLFYRLNVLNVLIPPLRQRTADILPLVDFFIANNPAGGRPKKMTKKAEKKLLSYSWPGNVRQLRNVIESALVLGEGKEIRPDDLVLPENAGLSHAADLEPMSLQALERQHVLRVLEYTEGNKKKAAELLGIERCTLYSKLKNYDA
ncbi:MAG: sigma 54-interacting transcriptional regulator [Planctomycetota bacterium]|nr:sigma 54-interacting transcriptional regulator [Planctomycetota bacterium]